MMYSGSLTDRQENVQGGKSVLRVGSQGLHFMFIVPASHTVNCGFTVSGRQCLVCLQRGNDCSRILTSCQMPRGKERMVILGWRRNITFLLKICKRD